MAYTYDGIVRAYQQTHTGRTSVQALQEKHRLLAGLSASGSVSMADDSTALAVRS